MGYRFSKPLVVLVFLLFILDTSMYGGREYYRWVERKEKRLSIEKEHQEWVQMKFQLYYLNRNHKILLKRYIADEKELARFRNGRN